MAVTLHAAAKEARCEFCITSFVRYECLHKPRKKVADACRERTHAATDTVASLPIPVTSETSRRSNYCKAASASAPVSRRSGLRIPGVANDRSQSTQSLIGRTGAAAPSLNLPFKQRTIRSLRLRRCTQL